MSKYTSVDISPERISKIVAAIGVVHSGTCKRVDVDDNAKVYICKNVIRIDLKVTEAENE